jgi:hypothetical protein
LIHNSYHSIEDDPELKQTALDAYHLYFEYDKHRALYTPEMDLITGNLFPRSTFSSRREAGWFGYSTGEKDYYKVTTVNDPDAEDVGTIPPAGRVEIYMMPQIALFAYVAYSPDRQTQETFFGYQVQPRRLWPRYSDIDESTSATTDNFLGYQKNRDGMVFSRWNYTGTPSVEDYTETPIEKENLTGYSSWACLTLGGALQQNFLTSAAQGGEDDDGSNRYQTFFVGSDNGLFFFENDQPFLSAVIKIGAQFYYVWNLPQEDHSAALQTYLQNDRFRLYQNIVWNPAYISDSGNLNDGAVDLLTGDF